VVPVRGTSTGRLGRALVVTAWLAVAAVAVVVVARHADVGVATSGSGATLLGVPLVAAQAAFPQLGLVASLALLVGVLAGRRALAVTSGLVALAVLVPVVAVAWPGGTAPPGRHDLTVYVHNLRYDNATPEVAVDQALGSAADVLVLVEVTTAFRRRFEARGVDAAFPHQRWLPGDDAYGAAILSRRPLGDAPVPTEGARLAAAVPWGDGALDGTLDVVAVHTSAPISALRLRWWEQDLAVLARHAEGLAAPTLLAGDFNATWWHPAFARLLEAGLDDAHQRAGEALTPSWPALGLPRRLGPVLGIGPFTRLDHALVHQADVVAVVDRPGVGSDHRAFEVTLRPSAARR
jgi:endonuclease/exonuclease/phosphatase (EEP) superfamily protein YafD